MLTIKRPDNAFSSHEELFSFLAREGPTQLYYADYVDISNWLFKLYHNHIMYGPTAQSIWRFDRVFDEHQPIKRHTGRLFKNYWFAYAYLLKVKEIENELKEAS